MVDRKPVKPRDRPDCCHQSFACALPAVALQRVSSAWSADKAAVPLGRRIPTAGVLFRSDSLLGRFPYEDIGSCLPEEGCQHQVRQPRRKKERVCIVRRTRPREASLTRITEPSLPQLLWEGASLPFDRLYKPALPSTLVSYTAI